MSLSDSVGTIQMAVIDRPLSYDDYEPRDVPGFESDIAVKLGKSPNQTGSLLEAVDYIEQNQANRYDINRKEIAPSTPASHGKNYPKRIRVTIAQA
jgi:hypothetical protein